MNRTSRFPNLSDFSEQVQEVNAASPPNAFRQLASYRLVQANEAIESLIDALSEASQEEGEPYLRRLQRLLLDAYQMFELSVQVSREDRALLAAVQQPVGRRVLATEHCRELPLVGWRGKHQKDVAAGMEAAELSLAQGAIASPWAALAEGRDRLRSARGRAAFELGFLIRMYQRVMAADSVRHN